MNEKQIKAICDAMTFLFEMANKDNDRIYDGIMKYDTALINTKVPASIIEHFRAIVVPYYKGRTTFIRF